MKIILLKRCKQGNIGDIVTVKDGFARNYLIPRAIAQRATPQNLKAFEDRRHEIEMIENQLLQSAETIRNQIGKVAINLIREASRDMKLYGAISQRDIAHAIKELCGIEIDYHKVIIPHKIKEVGICSDVYIKLHHDVIVPVELNILPQESK